MKKNPWPEPEGVTFVGENILWHRLDKIYKSWYFNKILRIYHRDNMDHISKVNKKQSRNYDLQKIRNGMWNNMYLLNNRKMYINTFNSYIKCMGKYCIQRNILKYYDDEYYKEWKLDGFLNKTIYGIVYLPTKFMTIMTRKNLIKKESN